MLNFKEIISVTLVLFSVIDILGSIPVILDLKRKTGRIDSEKTTLVSGLIMIAFLYLGESILQLFALDIASFAIAGALILFLLGLEMVLGVHLFKSEIPSKSLSIVPLAFPVIAGAGTMTTILSLRAEFNQWTVLIGIGLNLVLVYLVLKSSSWLEKWLGQAGTEILRKIFGVILLAMAIKLFKNHLPL